MVRLGRFAVVFAVCCTVCIAVLLAATFFSLANPEFPEGNFGIIIVAEPLSEPPLSFYNYSNPEEYILEAIANPRTFAFVGNWETARIRQIALVYGSGTAVNIKVNNQYYHVALGSADPPAPTNTKLTWTIAGWIAFTVAAVCVLVARRWHRNPK